MGAAAVTREVATEAAGEEEEEEEEEECMVKRWGYSGGEACCGECWLHRRGGPSHGAGHPAALLHWRSSLSLFPRSHSSGFRKFAAQDYGPYTISSSTTISILTIV